MTWFERWTAWVAVAAVVGTGVGYGVLRYLLAGTDEWGLTVHPLEPLALKLHVVSAPLLVFAVGLIAVRHVLVHIRERVPQGRRSGIVAVVMLAPMIASGYAIQVLTSERVLVVLAWVHGTTGVLFALGAIAHFIVVCRAAPEPEAAGAVTPLPSGD